MKFLQTVENQNFKVDQSDIIYTKTGTTLYSISPISVLNFNSYVTSYKTGLAIKDNIGPSANVIFFTNNGKKLVNLNTNALTSDIGILACSTGVMVSLHYADHKEYSYFFYDGAVIKDNDYSYFIKRVKVYEIYNDLDLDDKNQDKKANLYSQLIEEIMSL